jgi:hypothetical protein
MAGILSADFTFRVDSGDAGTRFLAALQAAQPVFDAACAAAVDPYVPCRTGALKSSVYAGGFGAGLLQYTVPYAAAQYYLHPAGVTYDGVRGPHWGERAAADLLPNLAAAARNAVAAGFAQS